MSARSLDMLLDIDPGTAEALRQLCQLRILKEQVDAQIAQDRMTRELREAKAVNGLGEVQLRVHGTGYHYWGQREGYDCWKDDGFRRDFLKRAPECKVKCGGTKVMVGWQAGQEASIEIFGSGKAPRFSKRYPTPSPQPSPPMGEREAAPSPQPSPPVGEREATPSPQPSPPMGEREATPSPQPSPPVGEREKEAA